MNFCFLIIAALMMTQPVFAVDWNCRDGAEIKATIKSDLAEIIQGLTFLKSQAEATYTDQERQDDIKVIRETARENNLAPHVRAVMEDAIISKRQRMIKEKQGGDICIAWFKTYHKDIADQIALLTKITEQNTFNFSSLQGLRTLRTRLTAKKNLVPPANCSSSTISKGYGSVRGPLLSMVEDYKLGEAQHLSPLNRMVDCVAQITNPGAPAPSGPQSR